MTDIGVVGHASVTIDPDFTGFAESVRTRLLPVLKQAAADVKTIDATVQALAKSMASAVAPAKQLADQLGVAASHAATLNSAVDAIDAGDLQGVSVAAQTAAQGLTDTAIAAQATNAALDAIDAGDLRGVTAAAASATGALTTTAGAAAAAGGAAATSGSHFDGLGKAAKGAALVAAGGFAAVGVAAGLAIKSAVDFETAFTGVTKTVDGSAEQIAGLRQGIIDMSLSVPASTTEIAAIAEAAGALGIETDSVLGFTRTMIDLGNTTNVTADQAATSFAKIGNVLGVSSDQFDEMGAALVALGNNGESTEAEILEMANRVAAAGATVGVTAQEALGLASSLASLGINAEAGGTAIQKTFFDMEKAVREGGSDLQAFAKIAGVSTQEFAAKFKDDPVAALQAFTAGLGKLNESGQSASGALSDLGINEARQVQTLLKLGEATDVMARDQATANTAWAENTALVDEASKRYATAESQLKILKNQMAETARVVGEGLLPTFIDTAKSLTESLGPAFATLGSVAGPALAGLVGTVGQVLAPIIEALAPVLKVLAEALKVVLESIGPYLKDFVSILSEGLIVIIRNATPAFVELIKAIGPVLPALAALAVDIIKPLSDAIISIVSDPAFLDAFKQLALAMADIVKALVELGLLEAITELIKQLGLPAIGLFRDALVAIRDIMNSDDFKNGILTIRSLIQGLTGDIEINREAVAAWQRDFDYGAQSVGEAIGFIQSGFGKMGSFIVDEVFDPIVGVVQTVFDKLTGIGDWLRGDGKDAWDSFGNGLRIIKDEVLDPIAGVLQTIVDWLNTAIKKIEEFGSRIPDWLRTAPSNFRLPGFGGDGFLGFAEGGIVPGPLGAPIPAIVHGGEFVVPAAKVPMISSAVGSTSAPVYVSIGTISGVGPAEAVEVGDIIGERVANRLAIRAAIRSA